VLALIAWLVMQFIMAPPLSGDRHHDFGIIQITEVPTGTPAHVFKLKNTTGQPLTIRNIKASCGCTEISPFEKAIPADGMAEIPVRMSLKRSTRESADITITFEQANPMQLSVEASGRLKNPLIIEPSLLRMRSGDRRPVTLAMEQWDDQERLMPEIQATEGIEVKVNPWKEVRVSNDARGVPALERTTLEVSVPENAPTGKTMINIMLGDETLSIPALVKSPTDFMLPEADQERNRNRTFNPLHRGELQENFEDEVPDGPGASSSSTP